MGPGRFMCVAHTVMNRNRVTDDTFGDKKFQQQNLNRIDEAVRDVSVAYGLAAVQEFKASTHFPSDESLAVLYKIHRNHQNLLDAFKEWNERQLALASHSDIRVNCSPYLGPCENSFSLVLSVAMALAVRQLGWSCYLCLQSHKNATTGQRLSFMY